MLASSLARLLNFLRSVGHIKPNAAHCFCAVAFKGGVAASAFMHWRFSAGLPASGVSASTLSCFPMVQHCLLCRELRPAASSRWLFATVPPSSSPWHSRPAVPLQRPCQQHLPDGAPPRRLGQQETSSAPPASNKPHPAGKSTPVWLAIWRTWAGFTNSQLRCAAFCCTYSYICTHPRYCHLEPLLRHSKSFGPSAPIAYATYVSPPNKAAAWPVGAGLWCWMRLSPGPWCSSCKSPRARILVLGTSGAHWPARWPRFELTERVAKS